MVNADSESVKLARDGRHWNASEDAVAGLYLRVGKRQAVRAPWFSARGLGVSPLRSGHRGLHANDAIARGTSPPFPAP
jgi:hypothetical protein